MWTALSRGIIFLVSLGVSSTAQTRDDLQSRLERLAAACPAFATDAFLSDRSLEPFGSAQQAMEHQRIGASLRELTADRAQLAELLKHADAKVRTLALAALFLREDGRDVGLLATLANDGAQTFQKIESVRISAFAGGGKPLAEVPQTVGEVARAMVGVYLHAAAFPWSRELGELRGFDAYWAERAHREHCASWFAVKMERACNEDPLPEWRRRRAEQVLAEIDKLPQPQRAWTRLFVLRSESIGSRARPVSDAELVATARELGRATLLDFLERNVVSDDPDLRADREPPGRFARIANFLLRHAAELFEPQDADALLAGEMRERARKTMYPLISSGWAIGAAELQPARASEILARRWGDFRGYEATGSALAAAALWRIRGATEVEFLADWFYARDEEVPGLANVPGLFLREAGAAWRADTPELLRALGASARFELTDWESLRGMLALASLNRAPPLVDERQISEAYRAVDRQVTFSRWRNLLRRECGFSELPPPVRVEARDAFTQPAWSVPLESEPRQIAFSPDGKTCAVVGAKSACELRDVASGQLLWKIPHPVRVLAVAFHENASRLTLFDRNLFDWNWRFSEWDVAKRERVRETAVQDLPSEGLDGAHVFDRTVSRFAVVGGHTISCFDVRTGTAVWQQRDDRAKPYAIAAMSANGQLLAAGGQSRVVRIFDAAKGESLRTIDGHSGSVVALVLSADGQTLVTATNEHLVSWWDTSTGALRKRFVYPNPMQRAGIMTASADARRLALTSAAAPDGEYQVGIFDFQSSELQSQVRGRRNDYNRALALAPNGEWLLVGSVGPARLDGWSMEDR